VIGWKTIQPVKKKWLIEICPAQAIGLKTIQPVKKKRLIDLDMWPL